MDQRHLDRQSTWLREVRRSLCLTQRKLAEELGVSSSYVGSIESAQKPMSKRIQDAVLALARARQLKVTTPPVAVADPVAIYEPLARVPLFDAIPAGTSMCEEESRGGEISVAPELGADFALRVRGDGMLPELRDGDIVLLRQVSAAEDSIAGDVVAALGRAGEMTLRRLVRDGNRWLLRSTNPAYPDIPLADAGVRIQGRMVGLQRGRPADRTAPGSGPAAAPVPGDWQALAERLIAALELQEQNERLRIEQVDSLVARARLMDAQTRSALVEELLRTRSGPRRGPGPAQPHVDGETSR